MTLSRHEALVTSSATVAGLALAAMARVDAHAHGALLRLVVPFRNGSRSIKAITEISFGTPGLAMPPLPS